MNRSLPAIAAIACLLVGCGEERGENPSTAKPDAPAHVTKTDQPPRGQPEPPTARMAAARAAVDAGRYGRAIAVAQRLGSASERAIRERIANRVARRALGAVRSERLGDARGLLRQADRYPSTTLTLEARIAYADARARAQQRARDLQAQVQQSIRRRDETARRARAQRAMERDIGP